MILKMMLIYVPCYAQQNLVVTKSTHSSGTTPRKNRASERATGATYFFVCRGGVGVQLLLRSLVVWFVLRPSWGLSDLDHDAVLHGRGDGENVRRCSPWQVRYHVVAVIANLTRPQLLKLQLAVPPQYWAPPLGIEVQQNPQSFLGYIEFNPVREQYVNITKKL